MNKEELIEILDSIVWYNGLYEPLYNLKKDIEYQKSNENYLSFDHNLKPKHENYDNPQFEIFWMMLVLKFGDYGTSPRSGWLLMKNKKEIINFIDEITKTSLGDSNE